MNPTHAIDLVTGYLDRVHLSSARAVADIQVSNLLTRPEMRSSTGYAADTPFNKSLHWAVCLHEASHAVVFRSFGTPVNLAKVVPTCGGFIEHETEPNLLSDAIGTLAGVMAELIWGVEPTREAEFSSSADVLLVARKISDHKKLSIDNRTVATLTFAIVTSRWNEIMSVAGGLRVCGSLTGAEIDLICRSPS